MSELSFINPDGIEVVLRRLPGTSGRFMPPVSMIDEPVPGQDGTRLREVRFDARQVVVPITVAAADAVAYRSALRDIARTLDPTRGEGVLRSSSDGQVRELRCRYLDGMGLTEDWSLMGQPSLLFRATDPFWYDPDPMSLAFTAGTAANFLGNPFLPLKLSSDTILGDGTVVNDGDVEAWPVWTVVGPASSITLTNVTTGQVLSLPIALTETQSVVIDTRPFRKTVRRNDGTNLFGSLSGALWPIGQGTVSIRTEVPGSTSATYLTLVFLRRWLSP